MSSEWKDGVTVLIDEVLVLNLPRHHHQGLHQRRHRGHVEALIVGEENREAESEGNEETEVSCEEFEEVSRHSCEHLN